MPLIVDEKDRPVAVRCTTHESLPVLNRRGPERMECPGCAIDQMTDAIMAAIQPVIESAAVQLDFLSGAGSKAGNRLRTDFAKLFQQSAALSPDSTTTGESH